MPKRSQPTLPFGDAAPTPSPVREPARAPASDVSVAGDPFAAQLAELCRRHPTRAKWLIVAGHAPGLALADRLARDTGGWANLRVVTPLDLAIRMAGPSLVERGVSPSEESVGPALVMKLLRGLAAPGYFRQLADQPSLADALWRTLRELRFAGVAASGLPAGAFSSAAKHAEMVALLAALDEWLDGHQTADMARVFAHAQGDGRFCPIGERDLVVEWPYASWDPIVRRFLDSLPGERLVGERIAPAGSGASDHARTFGTRNRVAARAATRHAARLQYVRVPSAAPSTPSTDDASLEIFHAGGRHAEIDEVARRVLAAGRPIDEVEVVCACDDLVWLAWEKCVRLGWKVTVSSGLSVLTTAPGRALAGWCDWVEAGFSATTLRRLLLSGAMAPAAWNETDLVPRLSPSRASRLIAEASPTWGRHTWAASLETFAAQEDRRADEGGADSPSRAWHAERARDARRVAAWVAGLLARVPDPLPGASASLAEVLAAARDLLASDAALRNAVDGLARSSLRQEIDRFEALGDEPWGVLDALRLLRGRAELLRVGVDRARPGHLHVSTLDDAGLDGRPVVFVVGLEEGRVFPAAREDPILLDAERAAIGAHLGQPALLRQSADRQRDAIETRLTRLAVLGLDAERVVLSYSCRDAREFRDTFASWVVLNAFRLKRGDPTLSYKHLRDALGDTPASPVPASPGCATTTAEWWVGHARRSQEVREVVLDCYPNLRRGRVAVAARDSDDVHGVRRLRARGRGPRSGAHRAAHVGQPPRDAGGRAPSASSSSRALASRNSTMPSRTPTPGSTRSRAAASCTRSTRACSGAHGPTGVASPPRTTSCGSARRGGRRSSD